MTGFITAHKGDRICVPTNNENPRISMTASTGLGEMRNSDVEAYGRPIHLHLPSLV